MKNPIIDFGCITLDIRQIFCVMEMEKIGHSGKEYYLVKFKAGHNITFWNKKEDEAPWINREELIKIWRGFYESDGGRPV